MVRMRPTYAAIWSPRYGLTPDPFHQWDRPRGSIDRHYTGGELTRVIGYERTPALAEQLVLEVLRAHQLGGVPGELQMPDLDVAV